MKYLFFDIECSNCFNGIGKMCEFGYVLTDENFQILSKNEIPMSPGKGRGNRFHLRDRMKQLDISLAYDYDYYFNQPEFPAFYERIKQLIEANDTICFAWSSDNDMLHLFHSCTRYNLEPLRYICYDLQKIAGNYLETNDQIGLKKCFLTVVGKNKLISLQEHLSSDDAKMSMLIFEVICFFEKKKSAELLNESEYAKDDAYNFCLEFENKLHKRKLSMQNHKLYKEIVASDKEHSGDKCFIGKRINLSGELKTSLDNLNNLIKSLHNCGFLLVNDLSLTDLFLCLNENNKKDLEVKLKDKYKGKFVLLESLELKNN